MRFSSIAKLSDRVRLGALVLLAIIGSNPAMAQQFLHYGRASCSGNVVVETSREPKLVVGALANSAAPVSSNKIVWHCDKQPAQTFDCPASTNIVQIDRRQGGANFSIICLRR